MSATAVPQTPGVPVHAYHSFKASPISPTMPIDDLVLIFDRELPNPPSSSMGWMLSRKASLLKIPHSEPR